MKTKQLMGLVKLFQSQIIFKEIQIIEVRVIAVLVYYNNDNSN